MHERKNRKPSKKNKNLSIDRHHYAGKKWEKNPSKRALDIDEVTFRLENDLPVDDLYDKIKYYEKYEDENMQGM